MLATRKENGTDSFLMGGWENIETHHRSNESFHAQYETREGRWGGGGRRGDTLFSPAGPDEHQIFIWGLIVTDRDTMNQEEKNHHR